MIGKNEFRYEMSRTKFVFSLVMVAFMILGLIFVIAGPAIDTATAETLTCQVVGAQAAKSGGGRGATLTVVEIKTRDCGDFGTYTGVNYQNAREVAAAIRPGVYDIEIGWYSRYFVSLWPNGLPTINSYKRVGPLPTLSSGALSAQLHGLRNGSSGPSNMIGSRLTPTWTSKPSLISSCVAPVNRGRVASGYTLDHVTGSLAGYANTFLQPGEPEKSNAMSSAIQGFVKGAAGPASSLR